jgi:hypothetical protein
MSQSVVHKVDMVVVEASRQKQKDSTLLDLRLPIRSESVPRRPGFWISEALGESGVAVAGFKGEALGSGRRRHSGPESKSVVNQRVMSVYVTMSNDGYPRTGNLDNLVSKQNYESVGR